MAGRRVDRNHFLDTAAWWEIPMAALPRVWAEVPEALCAAGCGKISVPPLLEAGLYKLPGSAQVGSWRTYRDALSGYRANAAGNRKIHAGGFQGPAGGPECPVTFRQGFRSCKDSSGPRLVLIFALVAGEFLNCFQQVFRKFDDSPIRVLNVVEHLPGAPGIEQPARGCPCLPAGAWV